MTKKQRKEKKREFEESEKWKGLPKVYLAGSMKFGENWREEVMEIEDYGGGVSERCNQVYGAGECSDFIHDELFVFVGAYKVDESHGYSDGNPHSGFLDFENLKETHNRCLKAIDECDIFAAYINRADLFGTFCELGYAKARGKRIWLGINPKLLNQKLSTSWAGYKMENYHDMWFLTQGVERIDYIPIKKAYNSFVTALKNGELN